ncbi:putative membrane protein [Latilactobacillus fuchuensis]|uniref:Membrane protein n=2 Tax=Latilactobacillus fuchuensis TaxID=164393 RepID=A0A2N9DVA9_9LACO|nr:putative membrane protein [Latilactobacillus fuchuensis]
MMPVLIIILGLMLFFKTSLQQMSILVLGGLAGLWLIRGLLIILVILIVSFVLKKKFDM